MSGCCDTTKSKMRLSCPTCTAQSNTVAYQTVLHHLHHPYNLELDEGQYFFCSSPDCGTVYFEKSGVTFGIETVRGIVGQKTQAPDRPICYCFDVSALQIETEIRASGSSQSKKKVIALTKAKFCECEIRNPAGACCLADFKRIEKGLQ